MAKDQLPNLKVLRSFRGPEGVHIPQDAVIPKSALAESDWRTLANMTPPKVEETDERVFDPNHDGKKAALPTA